MSAAPGSGQLPLALRYPPDQRFDGYVGGVDDVVAPLRALASAPVAQRIFVSGASGTGKTHLALAVCAQADADGYRVRYFPLGDAAGQLRQALDALDVDADLLVLDGLEVVAGRREDEVALFDLHNRAHDAGKGLLYAARSGPDDLPLALPDLRSRLQQCVRIALMPLDDAGRGAVLRRRAQRRGLQLESAAIDWLLTRTGRDLAGLTATLDRLDRASLAAQRRVTVPFLREVLGA